MKEIWHLRGLVILTLILGSMIGYYLPHPSITPLKKLDRNETFLRTESCEIWQICDYIDDFNCSISYHVYPCPQVYRCWEEIVNCTVSQPQACVNYINWTNPNWIVPRWTDVPYNATFPNITWIPCSINYNFTLAEGAKAKLWEPD